MIVKLIAILFALIGTPLFIVIGALALISFHSVDIDPSVVIIEMTRLSDTPLLISLPLFIFAGTMLSESGAPERILKISRLFLGWLPGGLAVIALLVCAVFTAFTGASGVTIFALGGLLLPAMLKDGYSERFSMGLITSSGSLGLLFPPSLPLILFGVIAETRIDHLFLAGIIPGFLMLILLCVYAFRSGVVHTREELADQHPLQILKETVWELPLPFIIIIGIYGGFLVAGEAAAVTALYVLIVEVFIYRDIKLRQIPEIMGKSMTLFGGILLILAVSMASTNYLIDQEIPSKIFTFINTYIDSKYTFLLLLNVFLLIVGSILDIFSALVLVVP
ncbi:MAG: TRAP transporter large permease subunit, partial [Desulfofustis sp.]|nr:TRAP transporter large permease subunit [Desulfofustis sp.]